MLKNEVNTMKIRKQDRIRKAWKDLLEAIESKEQEIEDLIKNAFKSFHFMS